MPPEIEFIHLDQALECGKMVFNQVPGLVEVMDLSELRRERGDDQDPVGALQPPVQRLPVDLVFLSNR